jgi:hypothetical protein
MFSQYKQHSGYAVHFLQKMLMTVKTNIPQNNVNFTGIETHKPFPICSVWMKVDTIA